MKNKELKPFDLEAALNGAPVVTRDGRKVLSIAYFNFLQINNQVVFHAEGDKEPCCAYPNGRSSPITDHGDDLFMAPITVTKWMNIYEVADGRPVSGEYFYDTEDEARRAIITESHKKVYVATVPVTWEK